MTTWELLPDLVSHFRRYGNEQLGIALDDFEIEDVLVPFLEKVQSPVTMRGLGTIFLVFHSWSLETSTREQLVEIFELPSWFLPALGFQISLIDPKRESDFLDRKIGSGWCENAPFYAWLVRTTQYHKSPKAREIQLVFIRQYYAILGDLTAPDLSTSSKTREQEVCAAARLVFDASNQDFRGLLEYITENDLLSTKALAQRIESYIKNGSSNVEQKNINYLRSLMHFLLDDWEAGRQRNRAHHFNKMIARRYNRTRRSAVQGNEDSLQELLPFSPDILDSEGIETDDFFPQQTFIEVNGQYIEGQNKKLIPAVERVFDRALNKKKSIDVSNKVRRGQNVCLQNTELLKSGDLARFIRFLTSDRLTGKYPAITLAFWIMWLIGKPLDEVTELYIFDNLQDTTSGMYIDPDGHGWWRFPVNYSAKPRLDDRNLGLIATSNEVLTACPSFLVSLVRKYYSGGVARLLPDSVDRELLVMHLKRFSDHQRCGSRINIEKIYSFTERFCFATGTIDPAVLDFSYQVSLSRTRVSRSYLCLDEQTRIMALHRLWSDITHYIVASDPEINCPVFFEERYWNDPRSVGSTFTPSQEALQHLVSHLSTLVNRLSPRAACPITDVIHYHNAYAVYTCFMLMFATGYRAVYNPLPSLSLSLRSYRLLGISDKDDSDFTHARLVCMPTILAKQLEYYTAHLAMLTEILRYRDPLLSTQIDQILTVDETILGLGFSDSSEWYQTIRNSRRVLGPLFHFRPVNRQWQAINLFPKALSSYLPDDLILPSNAGRHWMKSQLIRRQVEPEFIDWQMGHWMTGQTPLGYYSSLSHVEASQYLAPILDEMLAEVGWQAIPSMIT